MSPKKLGRGLDALITKSEEANEAHLEVEHVDPKLITVNRAQPRESFDEEALDELAQSIQAQGLLQPLVVRVHESGGYELIAGERRLRAALKLDLESIPVIVRRVEANELLELALIENIQREDLNPVELARAYQELRTRYSWNVSQLADRLGKKRSTIANNLRFLELPEPIQESLAGGAISPGHAKLLLSVDDADEQRKLHEEVLSEALTVRALEERIAGEATPDGAPEEEVLAGTGSGPSSRRQGLKVKAPHVVEEEESLARALGTKVDIREGRDRGRIIIEFYSTDDYERIRNRILARDRWR